MYSGTAEAGLVLCRSRANVGYDACYGRGIIPLLGVQQYLFSAKTLLTDGASTSFRGTAVPLLG